MIAGFGWPVGWVGSGQTRSLKSANCLHELLNDQERGVASNAASICAKSRYVSLSYAIANDICKVLRTL